MRRFLTVWLLAAGLGLPGAAQAQPNPSLGSYTLSGQLGGPAELRAFAALLGRRPDSVLEFAWVDANAQQNTPAAAWANYTRSTASLLRAWHDEGLTEAEITLAPIVVDKDLHEFAAPDDLASVAAGVNDAQYRAVGEAIVAAGFPAARVRIGHEFNGNLPGYAWNARPHRQAAFIAAFRRMVAVLRTVPGQRFSFVWNVGASTDPLATFDPATAYPGDDVVDAVSLDIYAVWYGRAGATPAQMWAAYLDPAVYPISLPWITAFATQHHKPWGLSEWGAGLNAGQPGGGNHGGWGDNPYFIYAMARYMREHGAAWHNYWCATGGDGWDGKCTDNRFPGTVRALREEFGAR